MEKSGPDPDPDPDPYKIMTEPDPGGPKNIRIRNRIHNIAYK
jgi:hypothetical protein